MLSKKINQGTKIFMTRFCKKNDYRIFYLCDWVISPNIKICTGFVSVIKLKFGINIFSSYPQSASDAVALKPNIRENMKNRLFFLIKKILNNRNNRPSKKTCTLLRGQFYFSGSQNYFSWVRILSGTRKTLERWQKIQNTK